jgi:processive 1,2-diacylglycerol beta-glucosyltransferase
MKKKVLLLTASYGTGHLTSSKSIENSLLELYPEELETSTIDFVQIRNFVRLGRIFDKIYKFSMQNFHFWDLFFNITDSNLTRLYCDSLLPIFYKKALSIFLKENPDLCITTHPYWNFLIDGYNRRVKEKIKYICVVTDAIRIHHIWISRGADYYIVCDKYTKEVISKYNIDKNKIFVKGLPVNLRFSEQISREKFLTDLGLKSGLITFLLVIGLGDTRRFLKLIDYLTKLASLNFQLIVITGKYKNIYNKLMNKSSVVPIKVIGWTDRMADFIKSCDLIISKGGGAIVMETLAAGKPVFIPVFTPGQERGNAEFIKKYRLGFVERDFDKVKEVMRELASKPELISEVQNRVQKHSNPHSAKEIAEFAHAVIFNKELQH